MSIHKLLFGTYPSVHNIDMFSFQGAGIEGFHCIKRYLRLGGWNRYAEVSSFQGAGIEGFHCIKRYLRLGGWNRYAEVSSF